MRLDKFLAESSIGTRKEVRAYIKKGEVTVNQFSVTDPTWEIKLDSDQIRFQDQIVQYAGKLYYMFHKPAGCITAKTDERHKTVLDYFSEEDKKAIFPVGRLDLDTEGLLFLTNDGEFHQQLMHPDKKVDKVYFFWAFGQLSEVQRKRIEQGIVLRGEEEPTKPSKLIMIKQGAYASLKEEILLRKDIKLHKMMPNQPVFSGYLTIMEGKKHQVKRMLKAEGCDVVYLKRISIGDVVLDESLSPGQYRKLTKEELAKLRNC